MRSLALLIAASLAFALLAPGRAQAQAQGGDSTATRVASCGVATFTTPHVPITELANGNLCVSASVSASITGFDPVSVGTPITAAVGGATGNLPSGQPVVVVSNTDSSNVAYCQLGATGSTSAQPIAPGGGWFAFTVGLATQITCYTTSSTAKVNLVGGTGLPTGTGGGGGSGGGGGGGNAAAGPTGSLVPADAGYTGLNVGGTLRGQTGVSPSGSVYAAQIDVASLAGTALGAPSAYGTSPGTVSVQGVNAFVTNVPAVSQSGTWTSIVTQGTASSLLAQVSNNGTFVVQASQSGSWLATVVGTGTFAVQAALNAETTKVIGTVRNLGNLGGVVDFAGQNASSPASAWLTGGQYNASPTTIMSGNSSPLQLDNGGSLLVHITAGAGSGGTASNFGSMFPTAGTAGGMSQGGDMVALTGTSGNLNVQCANCSGSGVSTVDAASYTYAASLFAGGGGFYQTTATNNALTNGLQGMFQVTANRALFTNLRNAAGTEIGTAATPVQVSLANTAANATALLVTGTGGAFPVTQSTSPWIVAGGGTAGSPGTAVLAIQGVSGGTAVPVSGAFFQATQPVSAGSGTLVDVTNLSTPIAPNTATATKGVLLGGQYSSTQATFTNAQQGAIQISSRGALLVAVGADGFAVTNTGTFAVQAAQSGAWTSTVTQGTASNLNATVVGTGTFAVQATLQASAATAIGKVDPNTIATWGLFAGQNASSPTNAGLVAGQFNTTPTMITSGNSSPLQLDSAGNLLVNVKAGAGGGTALGDASSFTQGPSSGTFGTPSFGLYATSITNLTAGQTGAMRVTNDRKLMVDQPNSEVAVAGAAAPTDAVVAGGTYSAGFPLTLSNGNSASLQLTAGGSLHTTVDNGFTPGFASAANSSPVVQAFSASTTLQSAAVANGNGTNLPVNAYGGAVLHVVCSVACSGGTTINFEASFDGTTYVAIFGTPLAGGVPVAAATTTGDFGFNVSGYTDLRARISAYSAGTITVTGYAAASSSLQPGTVLMNPGTAASFGVGATGAGVPANAIFNGLLALSAEPAKATTGNLTGAFADLTGKLVTSPFANRENQLRCAVTITASTAATTCTGMAAQGANIKIYVTDLCVTRSDAGTTADVFTLNDSATTVVDLPNNGGGGGVCKTYNTPLVVAANTAFQGTSGTSISSLHMSAAGFSGY